ncbi:uncharacterized protein [Haliotis asinina]|uniref:uncharacterized protein n=1 Tax=Haliotis asinina TaxID=109174 RepID=UPI003531A37E
MATGGDRVDSIPMSPGKEYHFSILYNYDSGPQNDIEKSLKVAETIIDTLAAIGLSASYYYDRDCLPGSNVFEELFRVVEASEYIIVVLTPGFVLGTWTRYIQQATFKELLDRGASHRFLPLCFGLNQNLRVPVELTTQASLEFSADWENDEGSWQKLRRVFTEQRSISNFSMYGNQRIGDPVEETNQNGGQQAEDSDPPTSVYNPITQQYEDSLVNHLPQGGPSADGEQIIYERLGQDHDNVRREIVETLQETSLAHDGEDQVQDDVTGSETDETIPKTILIPEDDHQVQGRDGVTGREIEQPLQETSLAHDGEDQVQYDVTGSETDETIPKTILIPKDDHQVQGQGDVTESEIVHPLQETSLAHDGEDQVQEVQEVHPEKSQIRDGEYEAQDSRGKRLLVGLFFVLAENFSIADSLSRVPVMK